MLKRTLFLAVVTMVAALEGFFLGPLGFDWLVGSVVITRVLAIGWMRTLGCKIITQEDSFKDANRML
jgi:hypothetical protein